MKLLFCPECEDIVKLTNVQRSCKCGKCVGYYLPDGVTVVVNSKAVVMGITNPSFLEAYRAYQQGFTPTTFNGYFIHQPNNHVIREQPCQTNH